MRFSVIFAAGACQATVAIAQTSAGYSSSQAPAPSNAPSNPNNPSQPVAPATIGDFSYSGCARLSPAFEKVSTSGRMSLDLCAASCPSPVFGVSGQDCYCAKTTSEFVAESMCDIACPGAPGQKCGGVNLLTVYKRPVDAPKPTDAAYAPGQTITRTITRTTTGVVTSCPPEVVNCPIGSKTTGIVVEATAFCPVPSWHEKKVVCYGDYCAPEHYCPGCERYRVVCEADYCHLEVDRSQDHQRLVVCKGGQCGYPRCQGDECNRKIVCFDGRCSYEKCYGDECRKNFVCRGEQCKHEQCLGDDCHKKLLCHGKECKPQYHCDATLPAPPGTPVRASLGPYGSAGKLAKGLNGKVYNNNGPNGNGPFGPGGNGPNGNGPFGPGGNGPNGNGPYGPGGNGPNGNGPYGPGGKGPGANENGPYGPGAKGPGANDANVNCPGKADANGRCPNAQPGSGLDAAGAQPTNGAGDYPVQVAGSSKAMAAFNILGAAAGLVFVL